MYPVFEGKFFLHIEVVQKCKELKTFVQGTTTFTKRLGCCNWVATFQLAKELASYTVTLVKENLVNAWPHVQINLPLSRVWIFYDGVPCGIH